MSEGRRLLTRVRPGRHQAEEVSAPAGDPAEEDTVRFATRDFRRRRLAGRWRLLRRVLAVLLVLGVLAGAGWLLFFSPYVAADRVEVTGTSSVAETRVRQAARVALGTPLARVDLEGVRARVESIPAVRSAKVSRGWPHAVRVVVTERVPVGVIDQGAGVQAMDASGVLFGRYPARPRRLPLVVATEEAGSDALAEAGQVLDALPGQVARRVDTVEVASVDRILLVLRNGPRVLWGSAEASQTKADVLQALLRRVGRSAQEIDVSVPGRPTTR